MTKNQYEKDDKLKFKAGIFVTGFVGSPASLVPPNTNANPIRIKRHERFDGFIEQQQITAETGFLLAHLTTKWQALGTAKFNGKSTWVFHCYFSGDL